MQNKQQAADLRRKFQKYSRVGIDSNFANEQKMKERILNPSSSLHKINIHDCRDDCSDEDFDLGDNSN